MTREAEDWGHHDCMVCDEARANTKDVSGRFVKALQPKVIENYQCSACGVRLTWVGKEEPDDMILLYCPECEGGPLVAAEEKA